MQSSLALFEHIFDVCDLPVDGQTRMRSSSTARGWKSERSSTAWPSTTRPSSRSASRHQLGRRASRARRGGGLVGENQGEEQAVQAVWRRGFYEARRRRVRSDGPGRLRDLVFGRFADAIGIISQRPPVPRVGTGALLFGRPANRSRSSTTAQQADPRPPDVSTEQLKHGGRRARLPLLGGRKQRLSDRPANLLRDPPGCWCFDGGNLEPSTWETERARSGRPRPLRRSQRDPRHRPRYPPSATPTRSWCLTGAESSTNIAHKAS